MDGAWQVSLAQVVRFSPRRPGAGTYDTSSISATQPAPYETVYGPSKAFGFSFAESLREELRGSGVVATALLLGATNSEFHHRAGMDDTPFGDDSWKNDQADVARQGYEARAPRARTPTTTPMGGVARRGGRHGAVPPRGDSLDERLTTLARAIEVARAR